MSQYVFADPGSAAAGGTGGAPASAGNGRGLEYTFLIFLIPLMIAGRMTLAALRTYPREVATASASVQAIGDTRRAPRSPPAHPLGRRPPAAGTGT